MVYTLDIYKMAAHGDEPRAEFIRCRSCLTFSAGGIESSNLPPSCANRRRQSWCAPASPGHRRDTMPHYQSVENEAHSLPSARRVKALGASIAPMFSAPRYYMRRLLMPMPSDTTDTSLARRRFRRRVGAAIAHGHGRDESPAADDAVGMPSMGTAEPGPGLFPRVINIVENAALQAQPRLPLVDDDWG